MSWIDWIRQKWSQLEEGDKLRAPVSLGHPKHEGFERLSLAMPRGQRADWALPYSDGSRIHVREFDDGRFIVHRDKYDPQRRLDYTFAHLMYETPAGLAAIAAVIVVNSQNSG